MSIKKTLRLYRGSSIMTESQSGRKEIERLERILDKKKAKSKRNDSQTGR